MLDGGFIGGGFQILFFLMFALVLGMILFTLVRNVGEWNKNNHVPRLTVDAEVVSKRMAVTRHHNQNGAGASSTSYYATFQVSSGDRMELRLNGQTYGLLAEGDLGQLTFQGTRYLDFQRQ